jgi:hypothetical protein
MHFVQPGQQKHVILTCTWESSLKYSVYDSWVFKMSRMYPESRNFILKYTTLIPHYEINTTRYDFWCTGYNIAGSLNVYVVCWTTWPWDQFSLLDIWFLMLHVYYRFYIHVPSPFFAQILWLNKQIIRLALYIQCTALLTLCEKILCFIVHCIRYNHGF